MGFFGLRKPQWKHADAQIRLAGVSTLTYDQVNIFEQLAAGDADARVRVAAASRINDQAALQRLLKSAADADVLRIAKERLSGVAIKIVLEKPLAACQILFDTITEQKSLAELCLTAKDNAVRSAAFARFTAQSEPSEALLATVAIQDDTGEMGRKAVGLIIKRGLLKDIARKAKHASVQQAAHQRAEALAANHAKPSPEQNRKARLKALESLVADTTRLAVSTDWERAEAEWMSLDQRRVQVMAEYESISLDETARGLDDRFARARTEFTQRRAAETARILSACAARETFLQALSAETSWPAESAAELRRERLTQWKQLDSVPASTLREFQRRFESELGRLVPAINSSTSTSLTATRSASSPTVELIISDTVRMELEGITAEAQALAVAPDRRSAQDRFRILHKRWMLLSIDLPPTHPLKAGFTDAYAHYKQLGKARREERDAATRDRLAKMEVLATEAEALAASMSATVDAKTALHKLKELQAAWKTVGPVRPALIQTVRARFRTACDQVFEPVRKLNEAEDWERFAHLASAEQLITQVEALATVEDVAEVAKQIKAIQSAWKDVGPLPRDKRESTWQRFRAACDVAYERLKPYFAQLDAQRADNLVRKQALIAELEQLANQSSIGLPGSPADIAAKKSATERVKALQADWKTIGPVPREADQDTWSRFRAAGDAFFAKHRAEFTARTQEQVANLHQKMALCQAAEDLAQDAEDAAGGNRLKDRPAHERLKQVKELQLSWKNVGHVPRDQVEAIWTRFRTACDRTYATLKEYLAEIEKERIDNLAKKQAIITEAEEILRHENARWFKDDLKELQRRWRDIGHVPREQFEDITKRFQDICQKMLAL